MFESLLDAAVKALLAVAAPVTAVAASGRMDDLILGWTQLSQVFGS